MIIIGSDHGGFDLKNEVIDFVKNELKEEIIDKGCESKESVDYPDIAKSVCDEVIEKKCLGILICGTGVGMSMSANKVKGIRAALCSEEYSAMMTRKHNDANVLTMGGRVIGPELAKNIVKAFLSNEFEGGRHKRRVDKMSMMREDS